MDAQHEPTEIELARAIDCNRLAYLLALSAATTNKIFADAIIRAGYPSHPSLLSRAGVVETLSELNERPIAIPHERLLTLHEVRALGRERFDLPIPIQTMSFLASFRRLNIIKVTPARSRATLDDAIDFLKRLKASGYPSRCGKKTGMWPRLEVVYRSVKD